MVETTEGRDLRDFAQDLAPLVEAAPGGPYLWGVVDDPAQFLADAARKTDEHGDAQPVAWAVQTTDSNDPLTIAYCGNGPRSHHSAALIAYLLNNATALAGLRSTSRDSEAHRTFERVSGDLFRCLDCGATGRITDTPPKPEPTSRDSEVREAMAKAIDALDPNDDPVLNLSLLLLDARAIYARLTQTPALGETETP